MDAPGLKDTQGLTPQETRSSRPRWDTPERSRTYLEVIPQGLEVLLSLQEKGPPQGSGCSKSQGPHAYQELQKPVETQTRERKAQP